MLHKSLDLRKMGGFEFPFWTECGWSRSFEFPTMFGVDAVWVGSDLQKNVKEIAFWLVQRTALATQSSVCRVLHMGGGAP